MTDLQVIKEIFEKRNIGYEEMHHTEIKEAPLKKIGPNEYIQAKPTRIHTTSLELREGFQNVGGYSGFVSVLTFNESGELIGAGAWE